MGSYSDNVLRSYNKGARVNAISNYVGPGLLLVSYRSKKGVHVILYTIACVLDYHILPVV